MQAKDSLYGNANYGLIDSNGAELTGLDIPMPQSIASKLAFPPTSGYFFTTIKDEALDTLDKIIVITKKGHLKLSFKTTIFTNGGQIDIQILKLNSTETMVRRQFSTNGYVEVNFNVEVAVNDQIAIYVQANVGGAVLKFIPADGYLVEQSAYILNMELIEPFDNIGSLVWSVDPNLESFGNCIRLDLVRPLLKIDYPLLYTKLAGTPYVNNDEADTFTIADFNEFPYLRAGATLALLSQNLPDPQIVSTFAGNNTVESGDGMAYFGGNNNSYTIDNVNDFTGCFEGSNTEDSTDWGGEAGAGRGLPVTVVDLDVVNHSHTISGTITNTTTNTSYSTTDNKARPNSIQMFLYMICDNQL